MGLLDDIKCSAKNVANKGDEAYNTAKYKNEIDTLERDIEKIYTKIGKAYYNNSANKESEFDKIPEFVEEINKKFASIDELNEKIQKNIDEHKAERDANREKAKAADEKS